MSSLSPEKRQVLELFSKGRELYKLRRFAEALQYFEKALTVDPTDGPSRTYVERCRHYIQQPPPPDWDGVWVMKTK